MKKVLFASTALIATAGFAAADVSFSGAANMGVIYNDLTGDWTPHYETTLSAAMTGETDGGLSFGADLDLTYDATGVASATVVYIEGGFGKLSIGDVDNAIQVVTGLSDIGFDGIGTDNIAEGLRGDAAANALYTGTFGDFGVALSYDMAGTEDWAIGVSYAMGDYSVGLGYDEAAGINAVHAQVGASVADFDVAVLYSRANSIDTTNLGVTAAYTMGAVTVTAAYSEASVGAVSVDGYGIGVAYDLGGGATVAAGVGEVGGVAVADLGINMSF